MSQNLSDDSGGRRRTNPVPTWKALASVHKEILGYPRQRKSSDSADKKVNSTAGKSTPSSQDIRELEVSSSKTSEEKNPYSRKEHPQQEEDEEDILERSFGKYDLQNDNDQSTKTKSLCVTSTRNQEVIVKAAMAVKKAKRNVTTTSSLLVAGNESADQTVEEEESLKRRLRRPNQRNKTKNYTPPIDSPKKATRKPDKQTKETVAAAPTKKIAAKKKQKKKKGPRTAYSFFVQDAYPRLTSSHPNLPSDQVMKLVGHAWRNITITEKRRYQELERVEKEQFAKDAAAEAKMNTLENNGTSKGQTKILGKGATSGKNNHKGGKAAEAPRAFEEGSYVEYVFPVQPVNQRADGTFVRPRGRGRKDHMWDDTRGAWIPSPPIEGNSRRDDYDASSVNAVIASPTDSPSNTQFAARRRRNSTPIRRTPPRSSKYKYRSSNSTGQTEESDENYFRVPGRAPRQLLDGTFVRPLGKKPKGYEWDASRGFWILEKSLQDENLEPQVSRGKIPSSKNLSKKGTKRKDHTSFSDGGAEDKAKKRRKRMNFMALSSLEMLAGPSMSSKTSFLSKEFDLAADGQPLRTRRLSEPPELGSPKRCPGRPKGSKNKPKVGIAVAKNQWNGPTQTSGYSTSENGSPLYSNRDDRNVARSSSSPLRPSNKRGSTLDSPLPQTRRGPGRPKGSKNKPKVGTFHRQPTGRTPQPSARTSGSALKLRRSSRKQSSSPSPGTMAAAELLGQLHCNKDRLVDHSMANDRIVAVAKRPSYVPCGKCRACRVLSDCGTCLSCLQMLDVPPDYVFKPTCVQRVCTEPVLNCPAAASGRTEADRSDIESLTDHGSFVLGGVSDMSDVEEEDEEFYERKQEPTGAEIARSFQMANRLALSAESDVEDKYA